MRSAIVGELPGERASEEDVLRLASLGVSATEPPPEDATAEPTTSEETGA